MNASNLKYRNRLKRRVMITRQQLYQPSPLHEPLTGDNVPRHDVLVGDNGNGDGHVIANATSISNSNLEAQNNEDRDGFVSRRSGSGEGSNNNKTVANRSDGSLSNNNNDSNQKGDTINCTHSNDGEAKTQRANEIISKPSQRMNNVSTLFQKTSPPRVIKESSDNYSSPITPTKRNSTQTNTVGSMIHRYERRGGGGPISNPTSAEQPHWIQPQQTQTYPKRQLYSNTKNATPSKAAITPPNAQQQQHQYRNTISPPAGQGEITRTSSMLTDEVMEDRNSMIRHVIHLERQMQLKRHQQQSNRHVPKQHQQQLNQQQQQPIKNGSTNESSGNEGDNNIVNLVNEAIAINVGMSKKKKSPLRSFQSLGISAKNDVHNRLGSMTTSTPNYKSTVPKAAVVTPDAAPTNPPPLPPPDETDLHHSPAPTDHSADAAAGMMFALHKKKSYNSRKKFGASVGKTEKQDESRPSGFGSNTNATTVDNPSSNQQLSLEQKLVRLTADNPTSISPIHGSSKVSVVSVTPSIESECVRQNAEILLAMEDAMMDFMGGGVGGDVGLATIQSVDDTGDDDVDEDEGDVHAEERLNEAFVAEIETRETLLVSPSARNTSSTLFSLEEEDESDEYADPPLMSSDDSNSHSDASSSGSGSISDEQNDGRGEFIITERKRGKNLGTFFNQLSTMFGVTCAPDRDEDSDIFYMNNSQFNTSVFSAEQIEEMHQRRIDDARKSVLPPTIPLHNAESFCGESHTTMPRGNTARQRDQLAYLSPPREKDEPAFQFARHDIGNDPPDPDLSLEIDDEDDQTETEGDCLPDPEEGSSANDGISGRDPPRGIDPEESEGVPYRNRLTNSSTALTLDHVKISPRERNKSSSLHWQSSNGLILDDETKAKQLASIRANKNEKIEITSTIPPSISANTTTLQEHFIENEHKLSPNYRRRGGGQLQFIDEVEDEDDDPSVEEESEGPQYDYEQFIEDFKEVVQKVPEACELEPVEEVVIGSISESSSLNDEEADLRPKSKPQNVTEKREMEAVMQRSMRQATSTYRQRNYIHPRLVKSRFQGQKQQRQTVQSSGQRIHKNAVNQPSHQAAHGHQYNHEQPRAAKTRLEAKLQSLGAPAKLSGDSVGTSELGSLYSASFAAGVPNTVFQRPNLPPSSMKNMPNQGPRQRNLNTLSRGFTPDFSAQEPLHRRDVPQPGHAATAGDGDGFTDNKNTLGFIPIGSETWKLKHEFLDSSPLDPPPRRSPLGFSPSSNDETSQVSDGFGRLNINTLGSLQVGKEMWKLMYDFHDAPAKGSVPLNPPQPQEVERMQQQDPPEPVAPPTLNRYRQKIPLRPPQPVRSDSSNRYSPQNLVMKSETENRDGTQVHSLRFVGAFVGAEDGPSPQKPVSPRARLLSGKKKLFQSFPSAVKVARPASSPQSQRVIPVVRERNESLQSSQPRQGQFEAERRCNQAAHIQSRQIAKDPMATHPTVNRSLEDKLRSVDPPSSEKPALPLAEASQVSGSVFEAVEVGSFGVQHTLFSKWDKPKDVNRQSAQSHPYQSQPPQRQPQYKSVSYISTFNGKQDQVVYKLPNLGRFRRRK